MNTRLQVEHPVTEMTTNLDIVDLQIRVAAGEPLTLKQEGITISGHAIQCRINAEDPVKFVPSPGRIWDCHFPTGFGIRVDTHAHIGYEMPGCFDSLLAKMITWGRTREEAIASMKTALAETVLVGVDSVIPLHKKILDEPDYLDRKITIQYLEEHPELI